MRLAKKCDNWIKDLCGFPGGGGGGGGGGGVNIVANKGGGKEYTQSLEGRGGVIYCKMFF